MVTRIDCDDTHTLCETSDGQFVYFDDYQKAIEALGSLLKAAKLLQDTAYNYGIGPIDTDIIAAAEEVLVS